jgi:hypothetical protein
MKTKFKVTVGSLGLLLFGPSAFAQVSCSPSVRTNICADVAESLNFIVDHGTPYRGVGIPVEIVVPAEYEKRLADTKELEKTEAAYAGGMDKAAKSPEKFSPWYRHTLSNFWSKDITFFRDKPSSRLVSAILISSAAFEGLEWFDIKDEQGKPAKRLRSNGHYDPKTINDAVLFIAGYLCGTLSTSRDGSISMDELSDADKTH